MASFTLNTLDTTAETLLTGESGFVGQNGVLHVAATDAINGSGDVVMTVLGTVNSGAGDGIDVDAGTDVAINIGAQGYVGTTGDNAIELSFAGIATINSAGTIQGQGGAIEFAETITSFSTVDINNSGTINGVISGTIGDFYLRNSGDINGRLIVATGSNYFIRNSGDILGGIVGSGDQIDFGNTGSIQGNIVVSTSFFFRMNNTGTVVGNIQSSGFGADIRNGGMVTGYILTGDAADNVRNTGVVAVSISTGGGDDVIDTRFGVVTEFLTGGDGNDIYRLGAAGGEISEFANEGIDEVRTTHSHELANNVEILTLQGAAAIDGTGNQDANAIFGNTAANRIAGRAGEDWLNGGAGDDLIKGGSGNDRFDQETDGDDTLIGGSGIDSLYYSALSTAVVVNLATGTATGDDIGTDTLSQIERVITGAGDDTLTGSAGQDDFLSGGGNDRITGAAGADTLTGGTGSDTLIGGGQADTFLFAALSDSTVAAAGRDRITDFNVAQDVIDLSLIDAVVGGGDTAFLFVGTDPLAGGAGRLRYEQIVADGVTRIEGDVNGDGIADFRIDLTGLLVLSAGSFVL